MLLAASALAVAGCGGSSSSTKSAATTAKATSVTKTVFYVKRTGSLTSPIQWPAVTVVGKRLLAVGGLDQADQSVSAITAATPTGSSQLGTLPAAFHDAAAATISGTAYVFGGGDAGSSRSQILSISPTGQTSQVGTLPTGESDVAAATVRSTAYIAGGYDGTNPLPTIVAFTPGKPTRVVGHLPHPLRYPAVAAVGGKILVAGGTDGNTVMSDVISFDPATGKVAKVATLPTPTTHAAGAVLNGRFYVIGGRGVDPNSQISPIVEVNPANGLVRTVGHLPTAISDMGAANIGDHIMAIGGKDAAGKVHTGILQLGWKTVTITAGITPTGGSVAVPKEGAIPALLNPTNIYAAEGPGMLSPTVKGDPALVYVPNTISNTLDVISQKSMTVIAHYASGRLPQHVVPSWDLKTLWVTNDYGNSLTAIDPKTGKPGRTVPVDDPYNLYFTADGTRAIVVAEALRRLDFRDPHTMDLKHSLHVDNCRGVDHMDYTRDGTKALVSCEFDGRMIVVDLKAEKELGSIDLRVGAKPQDVKISPDGKVFYIADMMSNGLWMVDAEKLKKIGFIPTGMGAHGLYPSRDAKRLFVSNRDEGSITVLSFATRKPIAKWRIPGGGSPDMGGVSADGKVLWLTGRSNGVLYAISTAHGKLLAKIPVGSGPHGAAVWPQPGRYSIGHTGILR